MMPWKFRDDISNGSGVIVLTETDKHPERQTRKRTLAYYNNAILTTWVVNILKQLRIVDFTC